MRGDDSGIGLDPNSMGTGVRVRVCVGFEDQTHAMERCAWESQVVASERDCVTVTASQVAAC